MTASLQSSNQHPATFFDIQVTVVRRPDGNGNAGSYDVTYFNKDGRVDKDGKITVTARNAIINYQLIEPTPDEITFTGMRKKVQSSTKQLGEPSISIDGRMMTFSNANTEYESIFITLFWKDGVALEHDPEIINNPDVRIG